MPIYQYKCSDCGLDVEKIQKFSDYPLTICPKCVTNTLEKIISPTSFRIGGDGVHKPTSHWGDMGQTK